MHELSRQYRLCPNEEDFWFAADLWMQPTGLSICRKCRPIFGGVGSSFQSSWPQKVDRRPPRSRAALPSTTALLRASGCTGNDGFPGKIFGLRPICGCNRRVSPSVENAGLFLVEWGALSNPLGLKKLTGGRPNQPRRWGESARVRKLTHGGVSVEETVPSAWNSSHRTVAIPGLNNPFLLGE